MEQKPALACLLAIAFLLPCVVADSGEDSNWSPEGRNHLDKEEPAPYSSLFNGANGFNGYQKGNLEKKWGDSFSYAELNLITESVYSGLPVQDSIARAKTIYKCNPIYGQTCLREEGNNLITYEWEPGCDRDYSACCREVRIDCEKLLASTEAGASDLRLGDRRTLCLTEQCFEQVKCENDGDCKRKITCPLEAGGPSEAACNPKTEACYCKGSCPDGFCDYLEIINNSCPEDCPIIDLDNDTDGLSDWEEESLYGTNTSLRDSDNDGLDDWQEIRLGSDPMDPDTDGGGQCDGPKKMGSICSMGPDPCPVDSSNLCYEGVPAGDSPWDYDIDGDGVNNAIDVCPADPTDNCAPGNDPDIDIDGDGMPETWARQYRLNEAWGDPDQDGLANFEEFSAGTNPLVADTNLNGLPDAWEFQYGVSDPHGDFDNDSLTNLQEYYLGTHPLENDTDGDGIFDGEEGLIPQNDTQIRISLLSISNPTGTLNSEGLHSFRYGDTLNQIVVKAQYSDGHSLIKPIIFGQLAIKRGQDSIYLPFNHTISSSYVSNLNYVLARQNRESPYMTLKVTAVDAFGNVGEYSTRLFVLDNVDEDKFRLKVIRPQGVHAYGQKAEFTIVPESSESLEDVIMEVFVEGTGERFNLFKQGSNFVGEYPIDADAPSPLFFYFLIYANGKISEEESYDSVERVEINVKHLLDATYLSDQSTSEEHLFNVSYPNGDALPDNTLRCSFGDNTTILRRNSRGLYSVKYELDRDKDTLVTIRDSFDNIGRIKIPAKELKVVFDFTAVFLTALLLTGGIVTIFFIYRWYSGHRDEVRTNIAERKSLLKRKKQLLSLIKDVKKRYYKKKVSGEYASRKIADYEGEIKLIEEELGEMGDKKFRFWKF